MTNERQMPPTQRQDLPDDDEPKTWRELAVAAIYDLGRYAHDEGPERRLVSFSAYSDRMALLADCAHPENTHPKDDE